MRPAAIVGAALCALACLAAGATWVSGWGNGSASDVPTETVGRGPFARTVHADGVLVAETATPLSVPMSARRGLRISWLAEDGTTVRQGDVVVRFDATDMEKQFDDGVAERDSVDGRREGTEVREGTELENLQRDAAMASRELDVASRFESKDPDIFSRVERIESRIDRELASRRRDHALGVHDIREDLMHAQLDLLDLERRRAEMTIDEAREGLSELEIRAPHDGVFVLHRSRGEAPAVGEIVWRGQPIAEIPGLDSMEANVFVLEADAGGIEAGTPADVVLEAHPDRVHAARVRTVSALAKRRSRWSPVQFFEVELELDRTEPDLMKPGQRVRAVLRLDRREDALSVARDAVFDDGDGQSFVWRRSGRDFERVPVVTGPAALGRMVIESGIRAGDVVALRDPTATPEAEGREPVDVAGDGPALPGALR